MLMWNKGREILGIIYVSIQCFLCELCHLPNHIPLQGALKGNLCPHYQK